MEHDMSNFASRLFTQSFKLLFRSSLLLGGLIFVSMARAIWHMVTSGPASQEDEGGMTMGEFHQGDVPPGSLPSDSLS